MIIWIIVLLCLFLIAVCARWNAAMDRTDFDFETSIWKHKDPKYYNKQVSWKYAKKIFGWPDDFWHWCKSKMLVWLLIFPALLITCLLYYKYMFTIPIFILVFFTSWIVCGFAWNLTFNLYFNKIFKDDNP